MSFFHTYPDDQSLDDNQHDYGWVVSCEYIDDDGCENVDTDVATFDNHDDALAHAMDLQSNDDVIKSYVWSIPR